MATKVKKELSERIKDAARVASVEITGENTAADSKMVHFKTNENIKGTAYSHDGGKTYKAFYDGAILDLMQDEAVTTPKIDPNSSSNTANLSQVNNTPDDEENNIVLDDGTGRKLVPTKQPVSAYNKGTLKMILRGIVNQYPNHQIMNKNIPDELKNKEHLLMSK